MDRNLARARFYVPGPSTAAIIRNAIALIELRYNLSVWLYVDRERLAWREVTDYMTYLMRAVPSAFEEEPAFRRAGPREVDHDDLPPDASAILATVLTTRGSIDQLNSRLLVVAPIPTSMQLQVTGIRPVGSVNIGTEGLGEPLKEVVRSVWSRKERAEARRHTEAVNRQKEREGDLDYHIKRTNYVLDSVQRIYDMIEAGVIPPEDGRELIGSLVAAQRAASSAIIESDIQYVDRTLKEIEE